MQSNMIKRSVLDERPVRIPIAGKIRAGIKVLKASAYNNLAAREIYEKGLQFGRTYDAIEKEIAEKCKIAHPLTPRNTPFFRVNRRDFTVPEVADRILELYADDRGDGRQLYRFPVVFAFDDWLENMPNGLKAFTKAGLKYWSEYDATGERFCMERQAVKVDERSKRAPRLFGGRGQRLREANGGKCIPEECAEYQKRECKLTGRVLFYIPGIPGSSLIELDTTSIYSLKQIRAQMELVAGLRNGRVSGTHNGKPVFMLTKVEEQVARINDEGQPEKTKQYLVNLESQLQMVDMITLTERAMVAALPSPGAQEYIPSSAATPGTETAQDERNVPPQSTGPRQPAPADSKGATEPRSVTAAAPADAGVQVGRSGPSESDDHVKGMRRSIATILAEHGKDAEAFGLDMAMKHGTDWSRNANKLSTVLADVERGVFS